MDTRTLTADGFSAGEKSGLLDRFWGDLKLLRIAFVVVALLAVFAMVFAFVQLARSRRAPRPVQTTLSDLGLPKPRPFVGLHEAALPYHQPLPANLPSAVARDASTKAVPATSSREPGVDAPIDKPAIPVARHETSVMGESSRNKQRRGDSEQNAALERDMREATWRRQPKESSAPFPQSQREDQRTNERQNNSAGALDAERHGQWTKGSTPLDDAAPAKTRGYAV
jgi:hypothetical protein